jgi:hypothetical protein
MITAWIAVVAGPIVYSADLTKHDFTLTTTGQAFERSFGHFAVRSVSLSASGIAYGKMSKLLNFVVKSGDLGVGHYGDFAILKGTGVLIRSCRFVHLVLKIVPPYGGRIVVWDLRGWVGQVSGNSLTVLFFSSKVLLPLPGYPRLYSLSLTGTLTLS